MFESNPITHAQYQKLKSKIEEKQVETINKDSLINHIKSTIIPICIDKCLSVENLLIETEEIKRNERLCLVDCTKKGIYTFSNIISTNIV